MVASVQDFGHPCFRASSALDRGFCGLWRLFECSNSLVATYCRQLLSVPCMSGKCAQMSVECGFGVRAPVCMCLVIRVVILEFEFMWDNTIRSFGRVQKNDHRQHCHVGNAGPALSTGLIPRLRLCWRGHTMWKDMLKDHDIQFEESGHPVYRASSALDRGFLKDSWTRKVGDVRFTSVRILRTQSFSFAQSILQISSVSTEQSRIGVMNWLSRFLGSHYFQAWSHPSRMSEQLCRKIGGSEYVQMRRVIKQRLIDCAFISDLWIGGIHEESLSWMLPNNSDVNHGFGGTTRSCREYTLTTSRKWTSTKLTEQFVWFRTWRCPNIRRFSMAGSYLQRMQPLVCSHHPKVTRKGSRRQGAHAWCFRCVLFFRHVVVSCFPAGTNIWNWMGKSSELGVPCCSSKTRIILIRTCGWH